MYTKSIGLVDITNWDAPKGDLEGRLKEFRELENFWGKRRKAHDDAVYSRVINPITKSTNGSADDYFEFFLFLLKHDYAYRLSVKNPPGEEEKWARIWMYPEDLENFSRFLKDFEGYLRDMAEIASKDKKKDHYLEIEFRTRDGSGKAYGKAATIEFREYEGKIVGYQVDVPLWLRHLFTITLQIPDKKYVLNHGIWVPEDSVIEFTPSSSDECLKRTLKKVR